MTGMSFSKVTNTMLEEMIQRYSASEILLKMMYAILFQINPMEIVVLLCIAVPLFMTVAKRTRERNGWLFFLLSIALILYVTLFRRQAQQEREIKWSIMLCSPAALFDDFLNALLYIPMGVTLARITSRINWIHAGLRCAALSIFCEMMQYLFARGLADVDDIIFNTLGGLVGYGVVRMIQRLRCHRTLT